jgi:hypothetical protein
MHPLSYTENNQYRYIIDKSQVPKEDWPAIIAEHKALVKKGLTPEAARHKIQKRVNRNKSMNERDLPPNMYYDKRRKQYFLGVKVNGKQIKKFYDTKREARSNLAGFLAKHKGDDR